MHPEVVVRSNSPEETQQVAQALAAVLAPGDVIALSGELGSGKTCFVQGAARGLGVTARVTSPSYVLMREYEGRLPVLHVDVYRLNTLQEALDLGIEEFLEPSWVVFVEWGDALGPILPEEHLEVEIRIISGTERHLVFRPFGSRWMHRLALVAEKTEAAVGGGC